MDGDLIQNRIISLLINGLEKEGVLRQNNQPEDIIGNLDLSISNEPIESADIVTLIDKIIQNSVNTNDALFMNQMYGKMNQTSIYADILTTFLNTSMYTYEVAPLLTLIEKECIFNLTQHIWGESKGDGVFTPGGSISNMKGLMLARNSRIKNVKVTGLNNASNYRVFISNQAHYSFLKGAVFMGFGSESIVKIKTNNRGQLLTENLLEAIETEKQKGNIPLMLVGVAGTTFSGVFDDLNALSQIALDNDMWYHVDAVYGGSLMFSEREKHKFIGIENADSVSWNLHKIMGIPLICSAFLTKEQGLLNEAFSVDADYLFHDDDKLDLGQKSLQCGRRVDALKLWLAWKHDGNAGFAERIDGLMKSTNLFSEEIKLRNNFELLCDPESPIITFRVLNNSFNEDENNALNKAVRNQIFKEGEILFNFSEYKGRIYLRCVISDPNLGLDQIYDIINRIEAAASEQTLNKAYQKEAENVQ